MDEQLSEGVKDAQTRITVLVSLSELMHSRDNSPVMVLQAKIYDTEDAVELPYAQSYGFSARPPDGLPLVVASLRGDRTDTVALSAIDIKHRPKNAKKGDAVQYTLGGNYFLLKMNGDGELEIPANMAVRIGGDANVTVEGAAVIDVTGTATLKSADVARIEGREVEIVAGDRIKFDVNGYGETWEWDGTNWKRHTRTSGPLVQPGTTGEPEPAEHEI